MSITVEKALVEGEPGEWRAMIGRDLRVALRSVYHAATPLYLEVQSLPDGFHPTDDWLRRQLGWTVNMLRNAKRGLIEAGLYIVEDVHDAAGRLRKVCRYVTNPDPAFSQLPPSGGPVDAGQPPQIPLSRGVKREGRRPHSPDDCERNAAGLACRQCGQVWERQQREKADREREDAAKQARLPAYRPVATVLACEQVPDAVVEPIVDEPEAEFVEPEAPVECEHGRTGTCVPCMTGKPDRRAAMRKARRWRAPR